MPLPTGAAQRRDDDLPIALITCAGYVTPAGRWIAIVPSLTQPAPVKHAVVMDGHRLFHDPGRKATYKTVESEDVKCGVLVVVTGPGWRPNAATTWQPREHTGLGIVEAEPVTLDPSGGR